MIDVHCMLYLQYQQQHDRVVTFYWSVIIYTMLKTFLFNEHSEGGGNRSVLIIVRQIDENINLIN